MGEGCHDTDVHDGGRECGVVMGWAGVWCGDMLQYEKCELMFE